MYLALLAVALLVAAVVIWLTQRREDSHGLIALDRAIRDGDNLKTETLLEHIRLFGNPEARQQIDLIEGRLRFQQGRHAEARDLFQAAYQAALERRDLGTARDAGFQLFQCLSLLNRHEELLAMESDLLMLLDSVPDADTTLVLFDCLYIAALSKLECGESRAALLQLERARLLLAGFPEAEAKTERLLDAHNQIGDIHHELGDNEPAIAHWANALGLTRQMYGEIHPQVGVLLEKVGSLQMQRGDWLGARQCLESALSIFKVQNVGDTLAAGIALKNLAVTLLELGDAEQAERVAQDALEVGAYRDPRLRAEAEQTLDRIRRSV